jgi:PKD repeat protein
VANNVVNVTAPGEVGFQVFLNGIFPNNDGSVVWTFGDGHVFSDVWTVTVVGGQTQFNDLYYYDGVETSNVGVSGVAGGGAAYDHIYATPGDYNATWTMTIKDWGSQSYWWAVCVSQTPSRLVAAASANVKAYAGNASEWFYQSYATGGVPPYSFTWYFGDGASDTVTDLNVTHTYTSPGLYQAFLKVTDSSGNTVWTNASAIKGVNGPQVSVGGLEAGNVPQCASPCSEGYYSAVSGAAPLVLNFTIDPRQVMVYEGTLGGIQPASPPFSYHWDFGDGSGSDSSSSVHTYGSPGVYCETVTITDSAGRQGSWSETIFVGTPSQTSTTANSQTSSTGTSQTTGQTTSSQGGGQAGQPFLFDGASVTYEVTVSLPNGSVLSGTVTYTASGLDPQAQTFTVTESFSGTGPFNSPTQTTQASFGSPWPFPELNQADLASINQGFPNGDFPGAVVTRSDQVSVPVGSFSTDEISIPHGSIAIPVNGTVWVDMGSGVIVKMEGAIFGTQGVNAVLKSTNMNLGGPPITNTQTGGSSQSNPGGGLSVPGLPGGYILWGAALAVLVIVVVALGLSSRRRGVKKAAKYPQQQPAPPSAPAVSMETLAKIEKLKALLDSGAITQAEFDKMKNDILSKP